MSAIKPIENRRVRGVPSERYPLNVQTSHPENDEEATEAHHCFPRSQQIGDSWFIEITFDTVAEARETLGDDAVLWRRTSPGGPLSRPKAEFKGEVISIIPHVTGLTSAEHEAIETHRAKILLEEGVWNWYDRSCECGFKDSNECCDNEWTKIGPLNPQPGSREGKPKKKRGPKKEKARARVNWQMRVPADELENGAGLMDDYVETGRELAMLLGAPVDADTSPYHVVITIMAAGVVAMNAEVKAQKAAEKAERAAKKAAKEATS